MSDEATIAARILEVLEAAGGEVTGKNATRYIKDKLPDVDDFHVSSVLGFMDRRGQIVRDMPNTRRVTRVAINDGRFAPGRKAPDVIIQEHTKQMAAELKEQLEYDAIEASGPSTEELERVQATVESLHQDLSEARDTIKVLQRDLAEEKRQATIMAEKVKDHRQLVEQLDDAKRTIAKLNKNIARMNSGRRPQTINEAIDTIEERLGSEKAHELRRIAQSVPGFDR